MSIYREKQPAGNWYRAKQNGPRHLVQKNKAVCGVTVNYWLISTEDGNYCAKCLKLAGVKGE